MTQRLSDYRRFWPILFLAICAMLPLWRCIVQSRVIGPFDQIRHMAPWNGPEPDNTWDVLQADGVLQFYPWRDMVFEAWGKHEVPAWNPYELAGTPLLANSQSAALYPPHILMGVLHVPTGAAMVFLAWLHLFWAGLGVYFLTRKLHGSRTGAAMAGAAFALSAFMVAWTGLPSVITTVAWIPWILAFIVALFEPEERRSRTAALLALCVAMMFLGGHLQFAAYGMMAAGVLALWLLVSSRFTRLGFVWAVVGLVLGGLLAAPQLLPVLNFGKFSHRANTPTPEGYQSYVAGAIPGFALQALAFPTAVGNPAKVLPIDKNYNDDWAALARNNADFAETALGLGPLVFVLLFFTRRLRGGPAALAVIGVVGLLLGLGTVLNMPLYYLVPGWSASGSPGRAVVLFVLCGCVLAGLALDRIGALQEKKTYGLAAGIGVVGLLLALAPVVFGINYSSQFFTADQVNQAVKASVSGEAPVFLATLVISLGAFCAARYKAQYRWALPAAAALCAFAAYGFNFIPTSVSTLTETPLNVSDRFAYVNDGWGLLRPGRNMMPPNTASGARAHDLGGYDSLLHIDSVNMLRAIDRADPAAPANGNMMFVKSSADRALLGEAGVTGLISNKPLKGFGEPTTTPQGMGYTIPGPGRAYSSLRPAAITSESFNDIVLQADGPGPLTLKDRMMPGWSATIDGQPAQIKAVDSPLGKALWRGVDLPAGSHTVRFIYNPPGLKAGLILFAIALLGVLLLAVPKYKFVHSYRGVPIQEPES